MTTRGRRAASLGEDELLSRLYRQLADEHAARFAAGYDLAAGLSRYRAWLNVHTVAEASEVSASAAGLSSAAWPGTAGMRAGTAFTDAAKASPDAALAHQHAEFGRREPLAAAEPGADSAVAELYQRQYRSLVRLAALLVQDARLAEEVVQDAFVAMHAAWPKLASIAQAEAYLRQSVVSGCRSAQRRVLAAASKSPTATAELPDTLARHESAALVAALRQLPARQREALVLRFYADLPEAQVAESMGVSTRAVRLHTGRALSALRRAVEPDDRTDLHPRSQQPPRPDPDIRPAPGREPA